MSDQTEKTWLHDLLKDIRERPFLYPGTAKVMELQARITTLLAVIEQCESHFKQITLVPCDEENVYDMWRQMHEEAKEGIAAIKKVKESK